MAEKFSALTLLLGDRLDLTRIDANNLLSTSPLAFRAGDRGYAVLFRYGVIVLCGLTRDEEERVLIEISSRIVRPVIQPEEDREAIEVAADGVDQIPPGGPIYVKELSPERMLVIADALAKSAALHRDEREVEAVLDVIEPLARQLSQGGRTKAGRRTVIRHIGQALLVRHRVTGITAIDDKPDVLWDRPDLERLYARLEDEYELGARADALRQKLEVIGETATALTDLIDTARSYRLEIAVLILVGIEVVIGLFEIARGLR
jgi:uncharacterized Rmd1/YagE family protein